MLLLKDSSPSMTSPETAAVRAPSSSNFRLWIVGFLLLGASAAAYWYWGRGTAAPTVPRGRFGGPNEIVSVRVVPVEKATIDVDVRALGTVTPFNTVTVRSRLDGELVRVLFTEGQHVSAGDLLAEIDSAAVPGAARPGAGTAGGEPRAAQERPGRPRQLPASRRRGPDHQAAGDHAGSAGAAVPGCAPGKRGAGEHRPAAARVHADCRSHRRPAGAPAGGRRAT